MELGKNDYGDVILKPVTSARAFSLFEEVAALKKTDKDDHQVRAIYPESTGKLILNSRKFTEVLPVIKLVTACPVLVQRSSGELITINRYDRESGVMASGPATVDCSIEETVGLLEEIISDFDFAGIRDRARALASLITPALLFSQLLPERAPIDVTEAN